MFKVITARFCYFFGFIFAIAILGFALYLQYAIGLAPCPLCELQRAAMAMIAIIFLIAGIHNPKLVGKIIYTVLILLVAAAGIMVASKQLWLQHNPPQGDVACSVGLGYLFQVYSFLQALTVAFKGTGDCAKILWEFLGISLPGWALLCFIVLAANSLVPFFIKKKI